MTLGHVEIKMTDVRCRIVKTKKNINSMKPILWGVKWKGFMSRFQKYIVWAIIYKKSSVKLKNSFRTIFTTASRVFPAKGYDLFTLHYTIFSTCQWIIDDNRYFFLKIEGKFLRNPDISKR